MAAVAPKASISFCFSDWLLITTTECPFCTNSFVKGLLMFPNEPVTIIFIFLLFCCCKGLQQQTIRCILIYCCCSRKLGLTVKGPGPSRPRHLSNPDTENKKALT